MPSEHYDPKTKKFFNPDLTNTKSLSDVVTWLWNRKTPKWPKQLEVEATPQILKSLDKNEVSLTFVNHATFLIQLNGINILTDPVWSQRVSPVGFAGPKRVINPGIDFNKLPQIDFVIISHNHYDHMDLETLKKLENKFSPTFYVPLNNKHFLESEELSKVFEMDWWEELNFNNSKITFVPAQHFSGRRLFDRFDTLWGGFVIEHEHFKLFFAGDTGKSNHFEQIAKRFNDIDVSFLPIGAYEPRWFMKHMHVNPKEAYEAHLVLNSKFSLGMHFGCFQLSDESFDQPVIDLLEAIKEKSSKNKMIAPKVGQTIILKKENNLIREINK